MPKVISPSMAFALVGIALPVMALPIAASAGEPGPTLRRVLLSTGGVGLFEYAVTVDGTATVTLPTRLDQVNDLLKSLTVNDPQGTAVSARLAVRDPLPALFRDMPFPPDALDSPEALFGALKGEEITLSGPKTMTGRIVSVNQFTTTTPDGSEIERHRIGLMTDKGLRQFVLEDAETISLADPEMRKQVSDALEALADNRREDSRQVDITLQGRGTREVTLAHVAEVPLWKATYRLTLPAPGQGEGAGEAASAKSRLTGWAVLENLSGVDWKNVELGVVSGTATTFTQDLYSPYHVTRPQVPVEVRDRALPSPDTGTLPQGRGSAGGSAMENTVAAESPQAFDSRMEPVMSLAKAAPAPRARFAPPPMEAADTTQVTAQVVFTLPQKVTLDTGQTLLVPLTDTAIPVQRVAHYQAQGSDLHPWAAARLTNTSAVALPPGAVSVTQDTPDGLAYLGDTRLTTLPPGQERLLSFAIDQDITVNQSHSDDRHLAGIAAAKGVVTLRQLARFETVYTIENTGTEDRTLVLDHPKRPGWTLKGKPDFASLGETPDAHRLRFLVPAGKTITLPLTQERILDERYRGQDLDNALLSSLSATGGLTEAEKQAVAKMAQFTARASEYQHRAETLAQNMTEIETDQGRLRENLKSVPEDSDLHTRFMDRLGQLEDRLTALRNERSEAEKEAEAARTALADYIAGLTLP
ncbi:hypothetical protein [Rhodospirillum sp. A1_3_36]|uniref:hypothetical protein n=1 Tax=Rhodospirillum sp. A1_3_36 TaxID=3391666 RepID=UPI0039A46479